MFHASDSPAATAEEPAVEQPESEDRSPGGTEMAGGFPGSAHAIGISLLPGTGAILSPGTRPSLAREGEDLPS